GGTCMKTRLAFVVCLAVCGWAGAGRSYGQPPEPLAQTPPNTTITKVTADTSANPPTLLIEGFSFGNTPTVQLSVSGGAIDTLQVVSAADHAILAQLPAGENDGSYLLTVIAGPGTPRTATVTISLGIGGPPGPSGPAGPTGPAGATGAVGDAG